MAYSVVVFGIRSEESLNAAKSPTSGLMTYMQTTLSIGYISIANDILMLLRCLLVTATLTPTPGINTSTDASTEKFDDTVVTISESPESSARGTEQGTVAVPVLSAASVEDAVIEERARERWWYRRITVVLAIAFCIRFVLGTIAGAFYPKGETNATKAQVGQGFRCVVYWGSCNS